MIAHQNEQILLDEYISLCKEMRGTDNAKFTRKRSKPDKHGHGNRKSAKELENCYQWTLLAYPNEKPRVIEQLLRQLKPYDFAWMIELAIEEFIGLTSCYPYDKLELIDNSFEANQAFD
ncbi:hypothetical protein Tco_1167080 [Tanacetum coccineum]